MSEEVENRCFIGGLSFQTTDRELKDAFKKFGHLLDAKVSVDKFYGRPRGFGFITFEEKRDMDEAIEAMNGVDLDGRNITVEKAQAPGSGRDRGGGDRPRDRDRDYGRDRDRDRGRDYGGGRGSGGGDCFSCGKPGHFARECPDGGGRHGGREDRYGGGGGERRSGPDRGGDRYGGDRYGGRSSRDSDRDGGGDRYGRERSGPYDRKSSGGYRS